MAHLLGDTIRRMTIKEFEKRTAMISLRQVLGRLPETSGRQWNLASVRSNASTAVTNPLSASRSVFGRRCAIRGRTAGESFGIRRSLADWQDPAFSFLVGAC
jgi:hypothetical protein